MRRRIAGLTKIWLCVVVLVAGCDDLPGRAANSSSQAPPAPSPLAAVTPPDQVTVAATVTPAPTATASPTATPPSATPTASPTTPQSTGPSPTPSEPPASLSEQELLEAEAVELTNAERADAGCPEVDIDDRLVAAARGHSEDMAERDFFDHTNPDGEGPGDRARAAGYDWRAISENIAWGYRTAEAVVAGWMDSPGHRRNILDCDVVAVGVGVADSDRGPYWTQVFGRE